MACEPDSGFALKTLEHSLFEAARWFEFAGDDLDATDSALPDSATKRDGQFCIDAKLEQGRGFGFGRLIGRQDTDAWHRRRPA